jgi:predicted lipoprotein with Yx(FWY)xxD motif
MSRTITPALRALLVVAALLASAHFFVQDAMASTSRETAANRVPVRSMQAQGFGRVLTTLDHRALYYWTPEKNTPGRIFCTGQCAREWPVLYVRKGVTIPRKVAGYSGTFGTIRRPDGRRQLTYNRLPLYTYVNEGPREVKCDDVNGWFVIRL